MLCGFGKPIVIPCSIAGDWGNKPSNNEMAEMAKRTERKTKYLQIQYWSKNRTEIRKPSRKGGEGEQQIKSIETTSMWLQFQTSKKA